MCIVFVYGLIFHIISLTILSRLHLKMLAVERKKVEFCAEIGIGDFILIHHPTSALSRVNFVQHCWVAEIPLVGYQIKKLDCIRGWFGKSCISYAYIEIRYYQCIGRFVTFPLGQDAQYAKIRECFHTYHFPIVEKITAEEVTDQAGIGVFHIKLILISGLIWMARGFEMVVIRFVTPLLPCEWKLTSYHAALLNTVTLLTTMLGCFLYGIWSDKYGRRTAFYSLLILFIFGAASAVMPNFNLFLIFRAVAGFSLGGFYQTLVLCCESFPGRKRGEVVYTLSTFWILGVIAMQHVLYSTIARGHGWRLFVFIGTLPSLIAFCLIKFYPESFRYRMVKGKYATADDIVAEMLKGSGQKAAAQLLQLPPMKRRRKLKMPFLKYSICLCILGVWTSVCYWSLVYITDGADGIDFKEYIYPKVNECGKILNRNANFMYRMNERIFCVESIHLEEFKYITWTTALDFPAFVIYLILSDWIGRKVLLTATYVLSIIFFFVIMGVVLLDVYMASSNFNPIYYYVFYYGARTLLLGQYDLLLLIVVETIPTSHRGMAVGLEGAMFQLGQLLGSYLGLNLIIPYLLFAYNILTFACSLVCYYVLEETRGKELKDIIEKSSDENIEDN